ncbi:hypothetical protein FRB90_007201 [Tulasnella sp. 427]|nr:hypothetical protein FRB90_007201 [Tulasnella sp. 427]
MSSDGQKGINYRTSCTGRALDTVNAHQDEAEITMFGANFCPFVQRVWVTLEYKKIPYRYVECDPYKKPKELLDLNPKGLVPALKLLNGKSLAESTVIMEYLEEAYSPPNAPDGQHPLVLPPLSDPYGRARARLEADKINRTFVPAFYRFLQAQETAKQIQFGKEFFDGLEAFAKAMDPEGPFFSGSELGFVDIMIAPWAYRVNNVLKHYRGFELPPNKGRYEKWADAVFSHPAFLATCSTEDLYIDSYARYAENRPGTSQVADAINSGRGLP